MLQTQTQISALPPEALALTNAPANATRPDHVDPLLWKLASAAERDAMQRGEALPHAVSLAWAGGVAAHLAPTHMWGHGRVMERIHHAVAQAKQEATARAANAEQEAQAALNPARQFQWGAFKGSFIKKLRIAREDQDKAALEDIKGKFEARFADAAKDPQKFHETLRTAFGDNYDSAAAEKIRQQTLQGDFTWMPKIKIAGENDLADTSGTQEAGAAKGCYVKEDDTVYVSRELLRSDPAEAERLLSEEIGHALDIRLNTVDALGDEGEIFATMLHDGKIDAKSLADMRADNDHGVIMINGKAVEVEYGWFKKIKKKIKKAFKKVVDAVVDTVTKVADAVADAAKKVAEIAKAAVNTVVQAVKTMAQAAVLIAQSAMSLTVGVLTGDMDKIREAADKLAEDVQKALQAAKAFIGPVGVLLDQVPALNKLYNKVVDFVVDVVKSVTKFAIDVIKSQLDFMVGVLTGDLSKIKDSFKQLNDAVKAIVTSKWLGMVMMVAQYIPIPILQAAVRVVQAVKAVYMLVAAIKNKSFAGILNAAAGAVGAAAALAPAIGMAANVANGLQKAATGMRVAAQAYNAAAQRDFTAAAAALSEAVGAPKALTQGLQMVDKGVDVVDAARQGDVLGAIQQGAALAGSATRTFGGNEQSARALDNVAQQVQTGRAVVEAAKSGDFAGAAMMLSTQLQSQGVFVLPQNVETVLSSAKNVQDIYYAVRSGNLEAALANGLNLAGPELCARLKLPPDAASTVDMLLDKARTGGAVYAAIRSGDYAQAANLLSQEIDMPKLGININDVASVLEAAQQASEALVDAVRSGDVDRILAQASPVMDRLAQALPETASLIDDVSDAVDEGREAIRQAEQAGREALRQVEDTVRNAVQQALEAERQQVQALRDAWANAPGR